MDDRSIQQKYAAESICFGCGPNNKQGLQINSFLQNDYYVCHFTPQKHHQAFPGVINGGIIGTILDCHSNWAAAHAIMLENNLFKPLCTVTADYHIHLKRPTPLNHELKLIAHVSEINKYRAIVEAELFCQDKLSATCQGTFVAVKQGHPAFHQWN